MSFQQTNADLILLAQKDHSAFSKLVKNLEPFIKKTIHHLFVLSAEDAEDIYQEVLIKIYTNLSKYNPDRGKVVSWVCQISMSVSRSFLKRVKKKSDIISNCDTETLEGLIGSRECATRSFVNQTVSKIIVKELFDKVDVAVLENLILTYVEGYSSSEMASLRNCNPSTFRTHLRKAKEEIRIEFEMGVSN